MTPLSLHVPKKSEGMPIVRAIFLHEKILYALCKGGCFHAGDVSGVERNGQRAEHPLDVTHPDVAGQHDPASVVARGVEAWIGAPSRRTRVFSSMTMPPTEFSWNSFILME